MEKDKQIIGSSRHLGTYYYLQILPALLSFVYYHYYCSIIVIKEGCFRLHGRNE